MPEKIARKRLETLEPDKPYLDGDEYIADMAALTALHWDEVDTKTRMRGGEALPVLRQQHTTPACRAVSQQLAGTTLTHWDPEAAPHQWDEISRDTQLPMQ